MTVGVIAHIENPGFDEVRHLARTAEQAGADWLGVADAFWWRDTWLLLAEAARVTERIALGPLVTNPYLRHPFVTVSALASLQDLAGPRVFAGLGAGGSGDPAGRSNISPGRAGADRAPFLTDPQRGLRRAARPCERTAARCASPTGADNRGRSLPRRAADGGASSRRSAALGGPKERPGPIDSRRPPGVPEPDSLGPRGRGRQSRPKPC